MRGKTCAARRGGPPKRRARPGRSSDGDDLPGRVPGCLGRAGDHSPAVAAAAAVVGAGVLAYVLYRKRREQQASEPIEGESRRIGASRQGSGNAATRARATRSRRGG